jgi:hypothetical protein
VRSAPLPRSLALAWGGASGLALLLTPWAGTFSRTLPACPLRSALGVPCPACGSGRALVALARLEPLAAFGWNPLAALAAMLFVTGGVVAVARELAGRPLVEPRELAPPLRVAVLLGLVANWAYLLWAGR